ncbi:MAG: hypothetical protein RLZ55_482 [Actinomycetota bacterium]
MQPRVPTFAAGELIGGRYRLEDDVVLTPTAQTWRGTDERLGRRVTIRIIAADSPGASLLPAAAARAGRVDSRYVLPVLDIVGDQCILAMVTDWTDWPALSYVAHEPMSAKQAVETTMAIGQALIALAEEGVHHGRLHPDTVHLDGHGQVKLRGAEVDSALHGVSMSAAAAARADAAALVGLLYLCLTGTWPAELADPGRRGLIPTVPAPNRLVADIPGNLNNLTLRAMDEAARGTADVRSLMAALAVALDDMTTRQREAAAPERPRRWRNIGRIAVAVGVAAIIAGLTMTGITQAAQERTAVGADQTPMRTDDGTLVAPSPLTAAVGPAEKEQPIIAMSTLDPDGDGSEYPSLLGNIVDGDAGTAWMSKGYYTADIGGKRGVGVVFDLGAVHEVTSVDLQLTGTATDFALLVGDNADAALETFRPVSQTRGAGQSVLVRLPRPTKARALVVWFTKLSNTANSVGDSGYRAGIRSATVYGTDGSQQ